MVEDGDLPHNRSTADPPRGLVTLARSFGVGSCVFFVAIALLVDDWQHGAFSIGLLVLGAGQLALALRLRVTVAGDHLVVRDWFRATRRLPLTCVVGVSTTAYDGFTQRGTRSTILSILSIRTIDGVVPVHATVAPWMSARKKRDRLREALGLRPGA